MSLSHGRCVLIDTQELLPSIDVHVADIQDRNGAETLRRAGPATFPVVGRTAADDGDAGRKMRGPVSRWMVGRCRSSGVAMSPTPSSRLGAGLRSTSPDGSAAAAWREATIITPALPPPWCGWP